MRWWPGVMSGSVGLPRRFCSGLTAGVARRFARRSASGLGAEVLRRFARRFAMLGVLMVLVVLGAGEARGFLSITALRARVKIVELELEEAAELLAGAGDDADVVIERARLGLYRGDCDGALALLSRHDVEPRDEAAGLLAVAKGCARVTAATLLVRDDERGVVVRFQDDADLPLFPYIASAAVAMRDSLERDLGTKLPSPVWIELVRDQLSLAAVSGLPESAAKTTGTVAVAKWGRVLMISPRAAPSGYPWLDTLAHEMTHLVLSQATVDRAPLWLQEGVAKRQEQRWRTATIFDGTPSHDDVALDGIRRGLGLALTGLGPSIAMLPSAEQAMVAFAEVASFMGYFSEHAGKDAMPLLLRTIRDASPLSKPEDAILEVSGTSLEAWEKRWRVWLEGAGRARSDDASPPRPIRKKLARSLRLGELLLSRGFHEAGARKLKEAHELAPREAFLRCRYADAARLRGDLFHAESLVREPADIRLPTARWWSLHDELVGKSGLADARWHALANDPFDPAVACDELPRGEYPSEPNRRALCEAARRYDLP
ncbi:MAG: hypothetical protein EXR75_10990 [Myxococcales bacterium]|nr:hypothetical protein [Myxococcales bacterium]